MSLTVLTVDDSRTMRDMLALSLGEAGYRVVQAEDGVQGLAVAARERPDVVITDLNMPRLDGFGLIAALRREGSLLPILVLTTEIDADKKARARQAGATGWIVKPFDAGKLVDAVRRVSG